VVGRYVERVGRGGAEQGVALLGGEAGAGDAIGQRRLADAARSTQQPRVVKAAGGPAFQHVALGAVMSDEARRLARMRRSGDAVGLGTVGWGAIVGHRAYPSPPENRLSNAARIRAATASSPPSASIRAQRCGSAEAIVR
jgi:hypothetical protein